MEIGITRISSKGQVVIPSSMRKGCTKGEELIIIREGGRFILKPLGEFAPPLRDDILFAEKTEQAFAEYKKGSFRIKEKGEFPDELASW
jgi:bifunctional DNA-binding transcriptional regulator/antitoxin component of YhaV-PrlF toxin-antitoxin module